MKKEELQSCFLWLHKWGQWSGVEQIKLEVPEMQRVEYDFPDRTIVRVYRTWERLERHCKRCNLKQSKRIIL